MSTVRHPVVSILMPIYGVELYIEEALRSIFEQNYDECRYIFVNDATPDASMDIFHRIVEEYPHRKGQITLIENSINLGIGATRNILLDNAQGDYLLFVDSDDTLSTNAVECMVVKAQITRSQIVHCCRALDREDGQYTIDNTPWPAAAHSTLRAIIEQSHLVPNHIYALLIERDLVEQHHLRFAEGVNMGEDYTLLIALLLHAERTAHLHEPLYHYRTARVGSYMHQISQQSIDSYIDANLWVTQYIYTHTPEPQRFHRSLLIGKLNIKKWILRRGLPPKSYDATLLKGWSIEGLDLRIFNWALNNRNNFIIALMFLWLNFWLLISLSVGKYLHGRDNRQRQMWG